MEIFSALLALCAGNSPVTGEFPEQRPVTLNFDDFLHGWVNNRAAANLRRHRAHYDVIVMHILSPALFWLICVGNRDPGYYLRTFIRANKGSIFVTTN